MNVGDHIMINGIDWEVVKDDPCTVVPVEPVQVGDSILRDWNQYVIDSIEPDGQFFHYLMHRYNNEAETYDYYGALRKGQFLFTAEYMQEYRKKYTDIFNTDSSAGQWWEPQVIDSSIVFQNEQDNC